MAERTHTTDQAKGDAVRTQRAAGRAMTPADVQDVQRSAGNRAAQRLIAQRAVQAKLTVGPVDDVYEREADRMAEAVMSSPSLQGSEGRGEGTAAQREPAPEEDELQMKPLAQREVMSEDDEVQRQAAPAHEGDLHLTEPRLSVPKQQTIGLGGSQLALDPQLAAQIGMMEYVRGMLSLENILRNVAQSSASAPKLTQAKLLPTQVPMSPAPAGGFGSRLPSTTAAPLVPPGAGPAEMREASISDAIEAVLQIPAVEQGLKNLQILAEDEVRHSWSLLSTGEKALVISQGVLLSGAAITGIATNPEARHFALEQLAGRDVSVPGLPLSLQLDLAGPERRVMFTLDVGRLLARFVPSLGFGPTGDLAEGLSGTAQRNAMPDDEELAQPQRAQRNADGDGSFEAGADVEGRIARSKGGGSALPDATRAEMEGKFGADFSGVRVHTGSEAAQLNRDLSAQAFTVGSDVYFGEGKFAPGSGEGKRLLGHELTHVVQQSRSVGDLSQRETSASQIALPPDVEYSLYLAELSNKCQVLESLIEQDIERYRDWLQATDTNPIVSKYVDIGSYISNFLRSNGDEIKRPNFATWNKAKLQIEKARKALAKGNVLEAVRDIQCAGIAYSRSHTQFQQFVSDREDVAAHIVDGLEVVKTVCAETLETATESWMLIRGAGPVAAKSTGIATRSAYESLLSAAEQFSEVAVGLRTTITARNIVIEGAAGGIESISTELLEEHLLKYFSPFSRTLEPELLAVLNQNKYFLTKPLVFFSEFLAEFGSSALIDSVKEVLEREKDQKRKFEISEFSRKVFDELKKKGLTDLLADYVKHLKK